MPFRDSMDIVSPKTIHPGLDYSLITLVTVLQKGDFIIPSFFKCIFQQNRAFPSTHHHLYTTHTLYIHDSFHIQCALIHYIHYYFLCSNGPKLGLEA